MAAAFDLLPIGRLAAANFTTGNGTAALFGVHELTFAGNAGVADPFATVATLMRNQWIKRLVERSAAHGITVHLACYLPYHSKDNPTKRVFGALENLLERRSALHGGQGAGHGRRHDIQRSASHRDPLEDSLPEGSAPDQNADAALREFPSTARGTG